MIKEVNKKQIRTFGITLTLVLIAIGFVQFLKGNIITYKCLFGAALVILIMTLLIPIMIKPLYIGALYLSHALGWFNTRLILGILFYLIFTPIAIVFRIIGRDPLERKFDKNAPSYWKIRKATEFDKSNYERQY